MEEASRRWKENGTIPSQQLLSNPQVHGQLRRDEENFTAY